MKQLFTSTRLKNVTILFALLLLICARPTFADTQTLQKFGDYTVHFSVFNSTFITPEVASVYQLTRAKDLALVNISVTRTTEGATSLGLPAEVSGTATNLIQQQRSLDFQTISEGDATYYIAPLRHTNEEIMHFAIQIQPDAVSAPFTVKFSRNLHSHD